MNETELSLHPAAGPPYVSNCLVVESDGRAHLELRRQEFLLKGHVTRATYQAVLDAKQLDTLQTILQRDEIRSLPQRYTPATPMVADSFHWMTANIYRSPDTQEIGYFEWHGKGPENAASAADNWSHTATAMEPLVEWFRGVKSFLTWRKVSNPAKSACDEP